MQTKLRKKKKNPSKFRKMKEKGTQRTEVGKMDIQDTL